MTAATATRPARQWIGGSDAAAVLGLDEYRTPFDLWQLKTGRAQVVPDERRDRILARGRRLEPLIISMAVDKLRGEGHDVAVLERNRRYRDPEHGFLRAEVDFELRVDGEHVNGEAKSAGTSWLRKRWGEEWTDEVPIAYAAQGQHGLMVTGRQRLLHAALIGLDDVLLFWIDRDDETIAGMRQREVQFWHQHVRAGVPPDPKDFPDLRKLHPRDNDRTVEATPEIEAAVARLHELGRLLPELKAEADRLRFDVARYMGDFAQLTVCGQQAAQWRTERTTRFLLDDFRRAHSALAELFTERGTQRVLRLSNKGKVFR